MKKARLIRFFTIAVLLLAVFFFGLMPILTGERFRTLPGTSGQVAVVGTHGVNAVAVLGCEPEGIAAALTCARAGVRTVLITREIDLGSYVTTSFLSHISPQRATVNGDAVPLNKGVYTELFGESGMSFTPTEYLDNVGRLVSQEENLSVMFETELVDVDSENAMVKSVTVMRKGITQEIQSDVFIDATRDGLLLAELGVPFMYGSADIGAENVYEPVSYNFRIQGVMWTDLLKIRDVTELGMEFRAIIQQYESQVPDVKLIDPGFVKQGEDSLLVTGLELCNVDVNAEGALEEAERILAEEARYLTAYISEALIPFENARFEIGPEAVFVPENRHYAGRDALTVSNILHQDCPPFILAVANAPVTAGRFVRGNRNPVVVQPNAYGITLASHVPVGLDNVLMLGSKAGSRSLASTSASQTPTVVTSGQGAGAVAAYCLLNQLTPAGLLEMDDQEAEHLRDFMERTGMSIPPCTEPLTLPLSDELLTEYWAFPQVERLAEAGIIFGGPLNDFNLDSESTQDVMSVLLQNVLLRLVPDKWTQERQAALQVYSEPSLLTVETACAMTLTMMNMPQTADAKAALLESGVLSQEVAEKMKTAGRMTLDLAYALAVSAADWMSVQP